MFPETQQTDQHTNTDQTLTDESERLRVCVTEGAEELVQVAGLPLFRKRDVQDVISLGLH